MFGVSTYGTVEELVPLVPALLDVALESIRVQRLEQLKATKELCRNRHDSTPVVEFSAILLDVRATNWMPGKSTYVWCTEDGD